MIAHLRGTVIEKQPHRAIVDVQGVGYEVSIPVSTYSALAEAQGLTVSLHIYTAVREDAIQLFGFHTRDEKHIFEKLITVNGVGPKLALTALSGLAIEDMITAIKSQDVTRLTKIPGVGKKTAERIVLELKDKLDLAPSAGLSAVAKTASTVWSALEQDVISALMNLGSQRVAAEEAVKKARAAGADEHFETLFRKALEVAR